MGGGGGPIRIFKVLGIDAQLIWVCAVCICDKVPLLMGEP